MWAQSKILLFRPSSKCKRCRKGRQGGMRRAQLWNRQWMRMIRRTKGKEPPARTMGQPAATRALARTCWILRLHSRRHSGLLLTSQSCVGVIVVRRTHRLRPATVPRLCVCGSPLRLLVEKRRQPGGDFPHFPPNLGTHFHFPPMPLPLSELEGSRSGFPKFWSSSPEWKLVVAAGFDFCCWRSRRLPNPRLRRRLAESSVVESSPASAWPSCRRFGGQQVHLACGRTVLRTWGQGLKSCSARAQLFAVWLCGL